MNDVIDNRQGWEAINNHYKHQGKVNSWARMLKTWHECYCKGPRGYFFSFTKWQPWWASSITRQRLPITPVYIGLFLGNWTIGNWEIKTNEKRRGEKCKAVFSLVNYKIVLGIPTLKFSICFLPHLLINFNINLLHCLSFPHLVRLNCLPLSLLYFMNEHWA